MSILEKFGSVSLVEQVPSVKFIQQTEYSENVRYPITQLTSFWQHLFDTYSAKIMGYFRYPCQE